MPKIKCQKLNAKPNFNLFFIKNTKYFYKYRKGNICMSIICHLNKNFVHFLDYHSG